MRRYAMRLWVTSIALVAFSTFNAGCHAASLPPSEIVADSVRDFSGEQGAHGWSYGYWDRSADTDKVYGQATDFQLLRHFGGDPINRISGHSEFTTGPLWNLEDGQYYTSLWAAGGHPNSAMKLGSYAQAEQWAVRRWVSTTKGPVTISGRAGKVMPWGEKWGGGVKGLLVVDGTTLFSADLGNRPTDYSIDATVHVGSLVDFLIGPNPSIGVTEFTATVRAALAAAPATAPAPAPSPAVPAAEIKWPVPAGWNHETIPFPLGFAPQLAYRGVEELRFAPGWAKPDQAGYWSYDIVWWLTEKPDFDAATMEAALATYFRGLSEAVGGEKYRIDPSLFHAKLAADRRPHRLTGRIYSMDAFATGLPITLNADIEIRECRKAKKHAVIFMLSPRPRTDAIWRDLRSTAQALVCE